MTEKAGKQLVMPIQGMTCASCVVEGIRNGRESAVLAELMELYNLPER